MKTGLENKSLRAQVAYFRVVHHFLHKEWVMISTLKFLARLASNVNNKQMP